ncbi:hypothetical protein BX666DRAFT_1994213 [Dichotomocladium elegans]|nr:hypothetical protein BX666DRAFT_1994213 [Dichotomocladium elegans]
MLPTIAIDTPARPRVVSVDVDNIRKFSEESLYSYSFAPTPSKLNRMHAMRHGIDLVRRIRHQLDDRVIRRYSHPDLGAAVFDCEPASCWSAQNTPRTSIDFSNNNNSYNEPHSSSISTDGDDTSYHGVSKLSSSKRKNTLLRASTEGVARPISFDTPSVSVAAIQYYKRAFHAPTRFLPQNQAIFTTDRNATILLFNDIASLCFAIDKTYIGKSLFDFLDQPLKEQMETILHENGYGIEMCNDSVLVCGNVVSFIKANGEKSVASLWLKRKERDGGKSVYIWIFEEIYESTLVTYLDSQGTIIKIMGKIEELYGYKAQQVIGQPVGLLIPSLKADSSINSAAIEKFKFFGSCTKNGTFFPVMITLHTDDSTDNNNTTLALKITSLPTIAGMITTHHDGTIQSMSAVPAKYLFGYPTVDPLVENMKVAELLPQFPEILEGLQRDGLWQHDGNIINNAACCRALMQEQQRQQLSSSINGKLSLISQPSVTTPIPSIYAIHRDGSRFEVQLRVRSIESADEELVSIWITFDRIQSMNVRNSMKRKAGAAQLTLTPSLLPLTNEEAQREVAIDQLLNPADSDYGNEKKLRSTTDNIVAFSTGPTCDSSNGGNERRKRPILPNTCVPSTTGLAPVVELSESGPELPELLNPETATERNEERPPPLPTDEKHPLDDYVIVDTLGEGTYGAAKLAYRKDDESKKMVVIKCILKSRILVDSWMRDRRCGDIVPAEIHILRTLKQYQQKNCCYLLTTMEDQDFYYIVMALHGDGMDLFDYIELNEHMSEQEVRAIFRQVAEAVQHLHHHKIVHRDIKDENIILDESGTVLLIDFGSAAYYRPGKEFETFCGTMEYWAPELLQGISYEGPPQDIWSLGILLHTLIFRETPFYQLDDILEDKMQIRELPYPGPHDLLHKMLNRDISKRPTIDAVLADPWLVQ